MGNIVDSILFQPQHNSQKVQEKIIWMDTSTGTKIPAFHLKKCRNYDSEIPVTILYSHANAEDLGNIQPWCRFLQRQLGVDIFAYDYTGYGLSMDQGTPCETQCYRDIDAAYSYLRTKLKIPAEKIVLYGRSVGTGPTCYLASSLAQKGEALGGMILHSPFMSVYRIVMKSGCTLPSDPFPNIEFCPSIRTRTLFIHGKQDEIIPFNHSQCLFDSMDPKWLAEPLFYENMGHKKVPKNLRQKFVLQLQEFLNDISNNARKKRNPTEEKVSESQIISPYC